MSDNYEKDMALTLQELLELISHLDVSKLEVSSYEKTIAFIETNKISKEKLVDFVKSLDESNYVMGPVPDNKPSPSRNKPVWVFKKYWDGKRVYIKIKMFITVHRVLLLSLHEDEEDIVHA